MRSGKTHLGLNFCFFSCPKHTQSPSCFREQGAVQVSTPYIRVRLHCMASLRIQELEKSHH